MLQLLNIRRNGRTIEAEYRPEQSEEVGYLSVSDETFELVKYRMVEGYGKMYLGMARKGLADSLKQNDQRTTKRIVWF